MGAGHSVSGGAGSERLAAAAAGLSRVVREWQGSLRLEILGHLAAGERSVGQLVELTSLEISHISHTLAHLRKAGMVVVRRRQRMHLYRFSELVTVTHADPHVAISFAAPGEMRMQILIPITLVEDLREAVLPPLVAPPSRPLTPFSPSSSLIPIAQVPVRRGALPGSVRVRTLPGGS